jgi:hydroxymethylpyrimidine/phosphomethylpyrimidine kinase
MTEAARALRALGPKAIVLKGGHAGGKRSDDLLYDAHGARWFVGRRIPGASRGTGCKLAAALATRLALGESLPDSVSFAKAMVRRSLAAVGTR